MPFFIIKNRLQFFQQIVRLRASKRLFHGESYPVSWNIAENLALLTEVFGKVPFKTFASRATSGCLLL